MNSEAVYLTRHGTLGVACVVHSPGSLWVKVSPTPDPVSVSGPRATAHWRGGEGGGAAVPQDGGKPSASLSERCDQTGQPRA